MFQQHKKPSSMNSHESHRPMCVQGDSGLVLTTDPKPRLRWTVELHERFVDAVTQLGGPDSTFQLAHQLLFHFLYQIFMHIYDVHYCNEFSRGYTKDYHEGHGCEGSHTLPPQEPSPGKSLLSATFFQTSFSFLIQQFTFTNIPIFGSASLTIYFFSSFSFFDSHHFNLPEQKFRLGKQPHKEFNDHSIKDHGICET